MNKKPANTPDYPPVAICFKDEEIAYLFAELVEAQGYNTRIAKDITEIQHETRIITESLLFDNLPTWAQPNCLVVSDRSNMRKDAGVALVRPLSEDRIEQAFYQFLPRMLSE